MDTQNFIHLHLHTSYSFLDGFCRPDKLASRAKELGFTAIAMTDHNHIGGAYDVQQELENAGIKFIPGLETYWTEDTAQLMLPIEERTKQGADKALAANAISKDEYNAIVYKKKIKGVKITEVRKKVHEYMYDMHGYHLILLAMNKHGWQNLVKLQSEAADKNLYDGKFYIDNSLLEKYNEDLILTTACIASKPSRLINSGRIAEARKLIEYWHTIFKDRMYLEIQPLADFRQIAVNRTYAMWSKELQIPLVATNDVHYLTEADHGDHDTLLCIGTGKKKSDKERMRYSNDFWLRTREEMEAGFEKQIRNIQELDKTANISELRQAYLEAMDNTITVADRIDDHIPLGADHDLLPHIKLPGNRSSKTYLRQLAYESLYAYAEQEHMDKQTLQKYEQRLNHELSVIFTRDFEDYMLIVREYVNWANKNGCVTGPGRGSAGGSLLLFLIGITKNIDPVKYNLLFERFLTVDRHGFPDIDEDFMWEKRNMVINHLEDVYGKECVCHIGTYSQEGVKSGLKDVARVLEMPFVEANKLSKDLDEITAVPPQPKFKDYDALKDSPVENERNQWKIFNELEQKNKEIFRVARAFEGCKRNFGIHASAVLAMPIPVANVFPTRRDKKSDVTVTLYPGTTIEELGGVKDDILGLKSVDCIVKTLQYIDPKLTMDDLYTMVDINDPKIYAMLAAGESDCVFQLESDMFKGILKQIKPTSLNDIAAITALG